MVNFEKFAYLSRPIPVQPTLRGDGRHTVVASRATASNNAAAAWAVTVWASYPPPSPKVFPPQDPLLAPFAGWWDGFLYIFIFIFFGRQMRDSAPSWPKWTLSARRNDLPSHCCVVVWELLLCRPLLPVCMLGWTRVPPVFLPIRKSRPRSSTCVHSSAGSVPSRPARRAPCGAARRACSRGSCAAPGGPRARAGHRGPRQP